LATIVLDKHIGRDHEKKRCTRQHHPVCRGVRFFVLLYAGSAPAFKVTASHPQNKQQAERRGPMRYTTVLFDLDGTLVDSSKGITGSVAYALRFFGIQANPADLVKFIGPPLIKAFEQYDGFDKKRAGEALKHVQEFYAKEGIFESRLYDGIKQLLSDLQKAGVSLLVATSEPEAFVPLILAHFKIDRYFNGVFGSNMEGTIEKADVIQNALKKRGVADL
jgi:phosphoglycolate phosphatase